MTAEREPPRPDDPDEQKPPVPDENKDDEDARVDRDDEESFPASDPPANY